MEDNNNCKLLFDIILNVIIRRTQQINELVRCMYRKYTCIQLVETSLKLV